MGSGKDLGPETHSLIFSLASSVIDPNALHFTVQSDSNGGTQ